MSGPIEQISREVLDAAVRRLCRSCAAEIARCMAETDTSFAVMAVRLNTTEKKLRERFGTLLDGESIALNHISDLAFAVGARIRVRLEPIDELPTPQTDAG